VIVSFVIKSFDFVYEYDRAVGFKFELFKFLKFFKEWFIC